MLGLTGDTPATRGASDDGWAQGPGRVQGSLGLEWTLTPDHRPCSGWLALHGDLTGAGGNTLLLVKCNSNVSPLSRRERRFGKEFLSASDVGMKGLRAGCFQPGSLHSPQPLPLLRANLCGLKASFLLCGHLTGCLRQLTPLSNSPSLGSPSMRGPAGQAGPEGPLGQREQHEVRMLQNWRRPHSDKGQQSLIPSGTVP